MSDQSADQELVAAAIGGEPAAVERLLLIYYSPLQRHVEPKIPADARRHFGSEDILQVVFSEVFRDIGHVQWRGDGSFFAWLKTIADHRLVDSLRKNNHGGPAHQLTWANLGSLNSVQGLLDEVCQLSNTPSIAVANREAIKAMQIAIAALPADQQEAICLNCLEKKSVEEVARDWTHRGRGPRIGLPREASPFRGHGTLVALAQ